MATETHAHLKAPCIWHGAWACAARIQQPTQHMLSE